MFDFPEAVADLEKALAEFRGGKLSPEEFVKKRTRLGIYGLRNAPDRYMVRVKIPAGVLSAKGLRCIAGIASDMTRSGLLHITTRQDIELHGLQESRLAEALERMGKAGLTTMGSGGPGVRNITCCPLSGVSKTGVFDATPYARALSRIFMRDHRYLSLPKKIKISFESCLADHVGTMAQDIGLQAALDPSGERGFRIWVGGGLGALPMAAQLLEDFTPEKMLLPTVETVLRVFDRLGDRKDLARARLKFLVQRMGIEAFQRAVARERVPRTLDLEEGGTEHASAVSPGPVRRHGERGTEDARFARWREANVRSQKQEGFCAVFIRCPLGDLTWSQAARVADLAQKYGGGRIRTAISQNLLLHWIPRERVWQLYRDLEEIGMATCCAEQLMDITRCVGGETCLSSITASRSMALALENLFLDGLGADPALKGLSVKVSGCPNACGHHPLADVGLFGGAKRCDGRAVPVYQIMLGGRADFGRTQFGQKVCAVPAARAVCAVEAILKYYSANKKEGETFGGFVRRLGGASWESLLADFSEIPLYDKDPSCYRDVGDEKEYRVRAKRGECSA